jgi:glucosamine kinase
MSYFLAVDAGGSKTEFLLAEDGRELSRARTGSIKRSNTDPSEAARNLDAALHELGHLTGINMQTISRTCVGASGDSVPLVTEWIQTAFAARVSGPVLVVGDIEIALDAAFQGTRGILALAGTGSNVAARDRNGTIMTAGGWGPVLADQGAGHWIGIEALRRGFLARDEGRKTELLEAARQLWHLPSIDALIEFANVNHPPRYASQLAPSVVDCAARGDEIAIQILDRAGTDLAYLVALLVERIRVSEGNVFTLPSVAFAGSILTNVDQVRMSLQRSLKSRYPDISFHDDKVDPVQGALWRVMHG